MYFFYIFYHINVGVFVAKYMFSKTTTVYQNDKQEFVLYNWLNSSYAVIFDQNHPLYKKLYTTQSTNKTTLHSNDFGELQDDLNYLLDSQILVPEDYDHRQNIQASFQQIVQNKKELSLILLPAGEACNFNCVYCYEDHATKSRMGKEHLTAIQNFIKSSDVDSITIEYFGGEPLINKSFMIELNEKVKLYSENNGKSFFSSATTNGWFLTSETLKSLYEVGVYAYQITLDGLPKYHNSLRPLNNGGGTFEKIISNIQSIVENTELNKLNIIIRVNFNENNSSDEDINEFLDLIKTVTKNDTRFSLLFRNIGDYSESNGKTGNKECLCSHDKKENIKNKYEELALAKGLILAETNLYLSFGSSSCYAAKPNNFVISPDWTVKKCTVALDKEINLVGNLLNSGELIFNQNFQKWVEPKLFQKQECLSCHFIAQCNSNACPLENMEQGISICPPQRNEAIKMIELFIKQENNDNV